MTGGGSGEAIKNQGGAMKPRLLDLFCGAGGAAMGYHRAGFDVVGVDIANQPNYPFEFIRGDVIRWADYATTDLTLFDAIHASPPCQAYTTMSNRHRGAGGLADSHDALIDDVREILAASGRPWVIENVVGARAAMQSPLLLHGGMFGLGVYRPRLFESSELLWAPPAAPAPIDPVGVYGKAHDGRLLFRRADGSEQHAASSLEQASVAMGIDWMTWRELAESIPPSYTEWIGTQLLSSLSLEVS